MAVKPDIQVRKNSANANDIRYTAGFSGLFKQRIRHAEKLFHSRPTAPTCAPEISRPDNLPEPWPISSCQPDDDGGRRVIDLARLCRYCLAAAIGLV